MLVKVQKLNTGTLIFIGVILVPLIGCIMAAHTNNSQWLWLLIPLMVFMEGGIFLIGLILLIMSFVISA